MKSKILVTIPSIIIANAFFTQNRIFQNLADEFDIHICAYTGAAKGTDPSIFNNMGFKGICGYDFSEKRRRLFPYQLQINTLGGRKLSRNCSVIYEMNKESYGNIRQRMIHRISGITNYSTKLMNHLFEKYIGENEIIKDIIDSVRPDLIITFLSGNTVTEIESIKSARLHGIPIVGLQYSIDNLCTRGLMPFLPDYMGVWGYQSRILAEKIHNMPTERIFHVGAPFGDEFKKPCTQTDSELRAKLGLPKRKRILLYAGSIWAYNEVRNLRLIEDAIEAGDLDNCCVFYRPHPFQHSVRGDMDFSNQKFKHVQIDPALRKHYTTVKNQQIDFDFSRVTTSIDFAYQKRVLTMASVIIAQVSTMMIQGAFLGTPSIGLLYVDSANERFWRRSEFEEMHLTKAMPGICLCLHPDKLIDDCRKALRWAEDKNIINSMKKHAASAIYDDDLTYTQRVRYTINAILHPDNNSVFNYLSKPCINIKNKENVIDYQ